MPKLATRPEGPILESDLLIDVRKWLGAQPDITIHRNAYGRAYMAPEDFMRAGMDPETARRAAEIVNRRFRGSAFGLGEGSSDLIGTITVPFKASGIDPDRVCGSCIRRFNAICIARFLAIELKQPGKRPTPEQECFLTSKRKAGAVAFWADSLAMVQDMIAKVRRGEI